MDVDKDILEGLLFIATIVIIGGIAIIKFILVDSDLEPRKQRRSVILVPWCEYCRQKVSEDHVCPYLDQEGV